MNLNDDKNILLAKKGVYAEQLYFYSKLCQTYQKLAEDAQKSRNITPQEVEQRYSKPLAELISSNDLNKTLEALSKDYIFTDEYKGKRYNQQELTHFKDFARISTIFKSFQKISQYLDKASQEKPASRNLTFSDMHKYMSNTNRPKTVRNFDKLISEHSPRFLGARFFKLANTGIENINQVDRQHIPIDFSTAIQNGLSPEKFGAFINGYKTIQNNIERLEADQPSTSHYDPDNWDLSNTSDEKVNEAKDEFSALDKSFKEFSYVAGSKVKKVYSAHKGTFNKAALIAVGVATLLTAGNQIQKEIPAHNLNLNNSTKYEQTIQDSTKDYLNSIIADLKLQSNSFDPQYEDVSKIEQNIDLVLDYIVRDQVKTAFEEYHEGYTVTEVNHWFDKKYEGSTSSGPEDYQFIDVYYVDDKGKEGMESIHDLRSDFFSTDPLQELFAVEEDIDLNSPVWKAFHNEGTKNFLANAQEKQEVMQYLEDATKIAQHFASFSLEHGHTFISNKPYLKSVLPEEKAGPTVDDDAR